MYAQGGRQLRVGRDDAASLVALTKFGPAKSAVVGQFEVVNAKLISNKTTG
jgi:hypothetical protein